MHNFNQYSKLFSSTFMLSAFTFGGGYVIVPLMQKKFVDELKWIDEDEMLDLVAIAQSSPGVMAVNASIILGKKLGGFKGSIVALLGTILPPFIILSILSIFYESFINNELISMTLQGMQAAIAAIIINAAIGLFGTLLKSNINYNIIIFVCSFILIFFFNISIIYLIIASIIIALILYYIKEGDNK